jgi:N,N'-diacetyllegionaminate synthase
MVLAIRNIEKALGDGIKQPSPSELKNIPIARKSIVASRSIAKGEYLSAENITVKRPALGISPMLWDKMIGTIASKNYHEDEAI